MQAWPRTAGFLTCRSPWLLLGPPSRSARTCATSSARCLRAPSLTAAADPRCSYENSPDRKAVVAILTDPANADWNCVVAARTQWQPSETDESKAQYQDVLKTADFTLCPAGLNVEAYRIYEAMSYGSVPILQRQAAIAAGTLQDDLYQCGTAHQLLKESDAPVVWLEDWSQLPAMLKRLAAESEQETFQRRSVACLEPISLH